MARAATGASIGVVAAGLAAVGHVAGGGAAAPVLVAILVAASALVFAAAAELRAPLWALAGVGALIQVAGHLMLAPLGGHSGSGGHAHGMPGQAARGDLDAAVSHLAAGGATMIAMHAVSFAALLAVLALAAPLAGLLISIARVLAPAQVLPTARPRPHAPIAPRAHSIVPDHALSRRGPPAFV